MEVCIELVGERYGPDKGVEGGIWVRGARHLPVASSLT